MNNIVITELYMAARLSRSGMLKYFTGEELTFYMTDICYSHTPLVFNNDRVTAKKMIDEGLLKIVTLDEAQMVEVEKWYRYYKPMFIFKTVTAVVYTHLSKFKLFSDDDLLRDTAARDFGIRPVNKEWLVDTLVNDIRVMGQTVDVEMIKQMI